MTCDVLPPRNPPGAESQLCRTLFALMAGALMMTMRVTGLHFVWVWGEVRMDVDVSCVSLRTSKLKLKKEAAPEN